MWLHFVLGVMTGLALPRAPRALAFVSLIAIDAAARVLHRTPIKQTWLWDFAKCQRYGHAKVLEIDWGDGCYVDRCERCHCKFPSWEAIKQGYV